MSLFNLIYYILNLLLIYNFTSCSYYLVTYLKILFEFHTCIVIKYNVFTLSYLYDKITYFNCNNYISYIHTLINILNVILMIRKKFCY